STCQAGKCQTQTPVVCEKSLICSGTKCKTYCDTESDCVPGFVCANDHTCLVKTINTLIYFDTALSGNISSDGLVITSLISAGDDASNNYRCGFASFKTSEVPKGSVVTSATLSIYQIQSVGTPYTDLGQLQAQAVKYTTFDKAALTVSSSASVSFNTNAGEGAKTVSVTSTVAANVTAGAANSQFRFCFAKKTDSESSGDFVQLASANNKPSLSIAYHQ
ncbi:MAG TPA: hypothetical protein VGC79_15665, partial [Polyangiaceae bacterium]